MRACVSECLRVYVCRVRLCMRECEADPRCKAFVTYGESCYFKQDIPEGLDAVKVCAAHPIFPQYR